jgi:hypothetical protein
LNDDVGVDSRQNEGGVYCYYTYFSKNFETVGIDSTRRPVTRDTAQISTRHKSL